MKARLIGAVYAATFYFIAFTVSAQELQWSEVFPGRGTGSWDVISTGDVVHVLSGDGSVLRQFDSEGNQQWSTPYLGLSVSGFAVASNSIDGSLYVGGLTEIDLSGQPTLPAAGAFLRKYDSAGNEIWARIFGTATGEAVFDVAVDASGVYVVVSPAIPLFYPPIAAYIKKFDHDGNSLWQVTLGEFEFDFAWGVALHEDAVYVTGELFASAVLWRLDPDGNVIWRQPLDLGTTFGTDAGRSVAVDDSGNAIYVGGVAGATRFGNTFLGHWRYRAGDGFLAKFNTDGDQLWNRSVFGSGEDVVEGVATDSLGRVVVAGSVHTSEDFFEDQPSAAVARFDQDGNQLWSEIFNIQSSSIDEANAVSTADSAIYVAGRTGDSFSSFWSIDGFLAKFDIGGNPLVQCPGDVNGDNIADIALVTSDGHASIRGLDGGLVSQFTLTDINSVVDVEMMPNINANGSPELVALGTGSVQAEVWDTLTAAQLSLINFDPTHTPLDLELVDDQTGNSVPELANLAQGSANVEVRDGLNGDPVNTVSFSNYLQPMDLEIYPNANENGTPRLAVLGDNKDPAKGDKVEVRDLETGNIVQNIWLGKGWKVLQQELLADHSGNGAEEVAVLRVKNNDDAVNVMVRDSKSGHRLGSMGFDRNYPPTHLLTISDVNGNGADEVVVFGQRFNGGNQKAQIKDSKTKALIKTVFFDKNFAGQDVATCADINGNGSEELVLLGKRASDGKLKAIVKDAKTGALIGVVNF